MRKLAAVNASDICLIYIAMKVYVACVFIIVSSLSVEARALPASTLAHGI